ncbi:BREX system ATP-binding protein BrxD [Planosporangium mesophilum]|uniref:ATP-binding protein n=1 Tax=Planosporangium mesophilum TaxID=689768 RepID=A0A8J3TDV3_9ACTN|nr:BREX system ATP-binding protein BrxD [Planosporangium mesophilum]NJC84884.1 BREX system ATP-binding protein BrxD [Planosporangium mesophilum]GII23651.1 ATP-binding protein [Planosporangium mesophilum]
MSVEISARRRREVIDALRRGTVPRSGLDVLAVGLDGFAAAIDAELDTATDGGAVFKAVRGEYGAGKTFFTRWLAERAKRRGLAVAEVQISETETPLHRLETVYRRVVENLTTEEFAPSALRPVLDSWIFTLEEDVLAGGGVTENDADALDAAVGELMERRLGDIGRNAPTFAAAIRGYRAASAAGEAATAEGLAAWLGGQPNVAAGVRRTAGVKGELDHYTALGFLQGLLTVLRDCGHPGLLVVLDEVETLQRMRSDVRDKALNALRQLIDEIDGGRFPGLYLVITGTPAFFDGVQGAQRLPPLAQRLSTDFTTDPRFDNPRAVQLRLPGFAAEGLRELGGRVRDLFVADLPDRRRVVDAVDDSYIRLLAEAVTGHLGGKVGIAPRVFLKKLVGDVLDRVELHPDFDPRRDYKLTLRAGELTDIERNAAGMAVASVDDIELELP